MLDRVVTILGTRPEIIRLSTVIARLDAHCKHILVHTGQNYDPLLSDVFFRELGIRAPDIYLGVRANSFSGQIGQILEKTEAFLLEQRPSKLLLLGDTNSGLSAIVARRLGIPVYHMEAGNRCYDDRVPEEVNRRVIDHSSTVLMPYTQRSRENLLREGIPGHRVFTIGNPIKEVIDHYSNSIQNSDVLVRLNLERNKYFLVTLHRAENVDVESRLRSFMDALSKVNLKYKYPVLCSVHPRTRARLETFGVKASNADLRFSEPLGFFDFLCLEQQAACILSDSGTVQEEACIFGVPNVTLRDVTERPETIDCGSNILSGANPEQILSSVHLALSKGISWQVPPEYLIGNVADIVARIILNFRVPDLAEQAWLADSR
jgi:UDP-N-acetylglucosamine 2-epimerase (non-hydrolysing)